MSTTEQAQPNLRQSRHQRVVAGDRLENYGERRRCEADDCTTVLSRYNPSSTCASHSGWKDTRQRSHA